MKSQLPWRGSLTAGRAGRAALNLFMPPQCPVTGEALAAPGMVGPAGWAALHFIEDPACRRCGIPFAADYGDGIECPSCIADPPVFDHARAAVVYDDASHKLIVGFKHSDRTELTAMFARWMARAGAAFFHDDPVLVPIALHRRRLMTRRFNQSALLAQALGEATGAAVALQAMTRNRATPPQKNLSADARRRNVAGVFSVREEARALTAGAHVILVDDVLTTGATLSSAARSLKKAGARRVDALVLARVVKGGIGAI